MRKTKRAHLLLAAIGLLGFGFVIRDVIAQEYHPETGYQFWKQANDTVKTAYLLGYADAESHYRFVLDRLKPLSTDAAKRSIEDFEYKIPFPGGATVPQLKEGIDEFYKDWRNRSLSLFIAGNIVRLQLVGRPQSEIDEVIARARAGQMEK